MNWSSSRAVPQKDSFLKSTGTVCPGLRGKYPSGVALNKSPQSPQLGNAVLQKRGKGGGCRSDGLELNPSLTPYNRETPRQVTQPLSASLPYLSNVANNKTYLSL